MKKSLPAVLLLVALLAVACGGADGGDTTSTGPAGAVPTEAPTQVPPTQVPPTEIPPTAELPEGGEAADDQSDFPPGTRLSTIDRLPAGVDLSLVLLADRGGALVVGVEPGNGQDIALGLHRIVGIAPDQLVAQVNAGPGFESLVHTFEIAGAYRLAVRDLRGVAGQFAMRVASSPGVALTVAPHHEVEGKLEDNSSLNYLHNGYAGREARFTVVPTSGDLDLGITIVSLLDMDTVLLEVDEAGPGGQETAVFVAPADEEYLVTVERKSGGVGVFRLRMTE